MSEEDLEVLITLDNPGDELEEEDHFHHHQEDQDNEMLFAFIRD